ncbi:MAG: glycosyltransferase [Latilactobacillus curvatus]
MNNKYDLLLLIVIYNNPVSSSETFKTIMNNIDNSTLVMIYDNSNISQLDVQLHENYIYVWNGQNNGLAEAYNESFRLAKKYSIDWVTLFDQDSKVPNDFLDTVKAEILKNKEYVALVPRIKVNEKIISPFNTKNALFGIKDEIKDTAINSGNTIKCSYINKNNYIFGKNYTLDFLDYDFFKDLQDNHEKFKIIDEVIEHNLSTSNYATMSDSRYSLFLKAETKFVYNNYISYIRRYRLKLMLRVLKIIMQRGSIIKIKQTFKQVINSRGGS